MITPTPSCDSTGAAVRLASGPRPSADSETDRFGEVTRFPCASTTLNATWNVVPACRIGRSEPPSVIEVICRPAAPPLTEIVGVEVAVNSPLPIPIIGKDSVPAAVGVKRTDTVALAPGARKPEALVAVASSSVPQRGVRPQGSRVSVHPDGIEPRPTPVTPAFGMTMVNNPSLAPFVALFVTVNLTFTAVPTVAGPSTAAVTFTGWVMDAEPGCAISSDTTNNTAAAAAVTIRPRATRRFGISSVPLWTNLVMRDAPPRGLSLVRSAGPRQTEEDDECAASRFGQADRAA